MYILICLTQNDDEVCLGVKVVVLLVSDGVSQEGNLQTIDFERMRLQSE